MHEDWDIKPVIFGVLIVAGALWLLYESIRWVLG